MSWVTGREGTKVREPPALHNRNGHEGNTGPRPLRMLSLARLDMNQGVGGVPLMAWMPIPHVLRIAHVIPMGRVRQALRLSTILRTTQEVWTWLTCSGSTVVHKSK